MTDDRHDRISASAHAIWEAQGRAHGQDRDHWDQATREIDAEVAAAKKKPSPAKPAARPTAKSAGPAPRKSPAKSKAKSTK